ncbi:hypothetical protein B0H13DRAFT_1869956 [Mycena leptocephala]|nr:hypothetical protein B0H13DRAFT_1869956 [Mycena leptocephala]
MFARSEAPVLAASSAGWQASHLANDIGPLKNITAIALDVILCRGLLGPFPVVPAIGPPAPGTSPIRLLPEEMLSENFCRVCAASCVTVLNSISFFASNGAQDTLVQTHPSWRAVAEATPLLWCKLYIDYFTPNWYIEAHVANMDALPLDVNIFFDLPEAASCACDSDGADYVLVYDVSGARPDSGDDPDDDGLPDYSLPINPIQLNDSADKALACLVAAKRSLPHWRDVSMWTSTDVLLSQILTVFAASPAPNIESLLFACPSYTTNRRSCDSLFISHAPLFHGNLPKLQSLHLISAVLPCCEKEFSGHRYWLEHPAPVSSGVNTPLADSPVVAPEESAAAPSDSPEINYRKRLQRSGSGPPSTTSADEGGQIFIVCSAQTYILRTVAFEFQRDLNRLGFIAIWKGFQATVDGREDTKDNNEREMSRKMTEHTWRAVNGRSERELKLPPIFPLALYARRVDAVPRLMIGRSIHSRGAVRYLRRGPRSRNTAAYEGMPEV